MQEETDQISHLDREKQSSAHLKDLRRHYRAIDEAHPNVNDNNILRAIFLKSLPINI